jgi:hypothetical protein
VEEGRLAYRVRTAEASDAAALRAAIGTTLAHPDHHGHRESYSGAASRGDILLLERFDRPNQNWLVAGFIEAHMRVDDNLSIHDIGTTGDAPQTGVVRYLLDQAFNSFRPVESQVKIRRDANEWLEIFRGIAGFYLDGEEYRRPHYWTIWRWDRQRAREDELAAQRGPARPAQGGPRPPQPPRPPNGAVGGPQSIGPRVAGPGGRSQAGPRPTGGPRPGGPRPGGPPASGPRPTGGPRPSGPRPGGPPANGPRPTGPRPTGPRPSGPPANGPRPGGPRPSGGPRPNGPRRGGGGQGPRPNRRPSRPPG